MAFGAEPTTEEQLQPILCQSAGGTWNPALRQCAFPAAIELQAQQACVASGGFWDSAAKICIPKAFAPAPPPAPAPEPVPTWLVVGGALLAVGLGFVGVQALLGEPAGGYARNASSRGDIRERLVRLNDDLDELGFQDQVGDTIAHFDDGGSEREVLEDLRLVRDDIFGFHFRQAGDEEDRPVYEQAERAIDKARADVSALVRKT